MRSDRSAVGIILANLFTMAIALVENWDLRPLLVIYWSQSVIIGVFNFLRIILLDNFSTEGFTSNGKQVPETAAGKWSTATFFALHYGMFHLVYAAFIGASLVGGPIRHTRNGVEQDPIVFEPLVLNEWLIGAAIIVFLVSHAFSFRENVEADLRGRPNLGTMMFLPYARVIPMHLTLIFGFAAQSNRFALGLFLLLKTGADWLMHVVEHRALRKNASTES